MEREETGREDDGTIELGAVSVETCGGIGPQFDLQLHQPVAGILDD
ncbi:benenodin family lasso peptide [Novosphingobium malaysiense]|nr:benenodin family lasso peptide [Novosphingobium malaysiense]